MVTTVTINPAVDKTYIVEDFQPYNLNRAERIIYNAGSKGINVSRVLRQLDVHTCVLGFVGGTNGDILLNELSAEGIEEDMVRVNGNTRLNIKIMDYKTSKVTEVNEPGKNVSEGELRVFMERYKTYVDKSDAIVLSGSILPGMSIRIYYDLIKIARQKNVPVFLDCGGEALREALKASPDYIKPNKREFMEALGRTSLTEEEMITESKKIIEKYGIKYSIITLGPEGALCITKDEVFKIVPPSVVVVSTVGAGDAFLAGLCHGFTKGLDLKAQLILATSFSNAKITKEGTNVPSLIELLGYTDGCNVIKLA